MSVFPVPSHDYFQKQLVPVPSLAKADQTRASILDAALDFLWTHPIRDMTAGKLTNSLGISRPAFYQYFPSVHGLMETLLLDLEQEALTRTRSWFEESGNVHQLLMQSLSRLVDVCYEKGPILRAVADAAPNDTQLEAIWNAFLHRFDDAIMHRIKADQALGLVTVFDAREIAKSLNRMNLYTLIHAFGKHPREEPDTVFAALSRIWSSTLYANPAPKSQPSLVRSH